ncbi:MAG: hypothetical protein ACXVW6_08220, partial [Nocardioidaceae bacterium]
EPEISMDTTSPYEWCEEPIRRQVSEQSLLGGSFGPTGLDLRELHPEIYRISGIPIVGRACRDHRPLVEPVETTARWSSLSRPFRR